MRQWSRETEEELLFATRVRRSERLRGIQWSPTSTPMCPKQYFFCDGKIFPQECNVVKIFLRFRAPLKTHRAGSGENIFRQSKQKSARIVDPMRRIFVTNDGKDSADSPCEGFFRGAL